MSAEITVTDKNVYLHCESCEQQTDCDGYDCPLCEDTVDHDIGFSFEWPLTQACDIALTIEYMRSLHNEKHHGE